MLLQRSFWGNDSFEITNDRCKIMTLNGENDDDKIFAIYDELKKFIKNIDVHINISYNDRDGYHLSLTKRRAELLQEYLKKNTDGSIHKLKRHIFLYNSQLISFVVYEN